MAVGVGWVETGGAFPSWGLSSCPAGPRLPLCQSLGLAAVIVFAKRRIAHCFSTAAAPVEQQEAGGGALHRQTTSCLCHTMTGTMNAHDEPSILVCVLRLSCAELLPCSTPPPPPVPSLQKAQHVDAGVACVCEAHQPPAVSRNTPCPQPKPSSRPCTMNPPPGLHRPAAPAPAPAHVRNSQANSFPIVATRVYSICIWARTAPGSPVATAGAYFQVGRRGRG